MEDFWSNLLGGAGQLYGYSQLLDDLSGQREDLGTFFSDLTGSVTGAGEFTPVTVKSGIGTVTGGDMTLNAPWNNLSNVMRREGKEALLAAGGDPAAREQAVYDRMRSAQMPEEQRMMDTMNTSLLNRGRSGMTTNAYGGSSEQFAMQKAIAENKDRAMLGAMGQAQNELMNQLQIGQGLMGQAYAPHEMLMKNAGYGINLNELQQRSDLSTQGLLAQLGLGQMTGEANLSNIMGNAFGNMVMGGSSMLGGVGGLLDTVLNSDKGADAISGIPILGDLYDLIYK